MAAEMEEDFKKLELDRARVERLGYVHCGIPTSSQHAAAIADASVPRILPTDNLAMSYPQLLNPVSSSLASSSGLYQPQIPVDGRPLGDWSFRGNPQVSMIVLQVFQDFWADVLFVRPCHKCSHPILTPVS